MYLSGIIEVFILPGAVALSIVLLLLTIAKSRHDK